MTAASTAPHAMAIKRPFRIRTITAFVTLHADDFDDDVTADGITTTPGIEKKIDKCNNILRKLETRLTSIGYEVQTVRIATNPFGEWLTQNNDGDKTMDTTTIHKRLKQLNSLLDAKNINFCSLGPSTTPKHTTQICPIIVASSGKFSCSAKINAGDIHAATAAAKCMQKISTLGDDDVIEGTNADHVKGGLGNFRFCAASCVETVPFFPGAKAPSTKDVDDTFNFAIGLENGGFAFDLLEEAKNIGNIKNIFDTKMREELLPIQNVCLKFADDAAADYPVEYLGIDTSLNPSLDDGGSVADAIERLEEVRGDFGGTGSLAAAAAITIALQSMPDILTTGYSGLMLPVLEDQRLAELGMASNSSKNKLTIQKLLCLSSVCGVGVDTVPIPGNVSEDSLSSLILDVAALAGRWSRNNVNKPLSCRVFPVPGGNAGEMTTFDSPYMCNSCIFDL